MPSRPGANLLSMIALGAISSIGTAHAQEGAPLTDPPPQLTPDRVYALDIAMESILQEFAIPGLAIGIVEDGEPVYIRGFGVRDKKTDEPVNAHTLFHVASITKSFTATAIMQLAERDQLGLEETMADSSSTVAQLLTRQDAAFNALGAMIESTTQQKYLHYMHSKILRPAGLMESTFEVPIVNSNVAWPHVGRVFVRRATRYPRDEASLPSTGLSASIADITRWAALHVSRDPALLERDSYEALIRHRRDGERADTAVALGWRLERRDDDWLPHHAVKARGFSALLTLYPKQQRAIVILSNGETTPSKEIRRVIESVLAGESFLAPKPSLLLRSDVQWALGALVAMSLLLFAVSVHYRRRRQPD
ncbi:beta-lactamase family protein [Steroidobacter sp. S1-65]|uniref:Beta-lactamase family protein n=1 Tax=Steroidobacter gossypii TaxID=2805490 RepID=A0ABS1X6G9_9GAMM|nr:serine hydrolase domain-containing protein [Steroidobacter gossypii]MBM0108827.1 beta-lactamase family protein [Steroidobacter gossypii]